MLQGAIVNTAAVLGRACLVNAGALVDHDAVLANGAHANLHATVKGWARLEECRHTEAAEVVAPERRAIPGVEAESPLEEALYAFKMCIRDSLSPRAPSLAAQPNRQPHRANRGSRRPLRHTRPVRAAARG